MVLPLIIKTKKIVNKKNVKIYSVLWILKSSSVFKIAAQASEAGDFLNSFLRF